MRVRLEVEQAHRAEARRAQLEHEARLRRLDAEARGARTARLLALSLVLTCIGAASAYLLAFGPALEAERAAAERARRQVALHASELAALQMRVEREQSGMAATHATPTRGSGSAHGGPEGPTGTAAEQPTATRTGGEGAAGGGGRDRKPRADAPTGKPRRHGGATGHPAKSRTEDDPLGTLQLDDGDPLLGL
ncbi:MAG: hypothetical protein PVI30_15700 [Myxococcales bacterium]